MNPLLVIALCATSLILFRLAFALPGKLRATTRSGFSFGDGLLCTAWTLGIVATVGGMAGSA